MKRRKGNPFAFLALILLGFILVFGIIYNQYSNSLNSLIMEDDFVLFTVEPGTTLYGALEKLEHEGIIKSATNAKIYAKLNKETNINAGLYQLNKDSTVPEIIDFMQGNNAIIDQVMITIPEGYWAIQIASLLENKLSVSSAELLKAWNDEEYVKTLINDYEVLTDEILNKDSLVLLEGYLFPETYSFIVDTNVDQVTRRMLDHTEKIYLKYKDDFTNSKYSIHELMTLASIVQFESGNEEEMPLVSSVFHNRLKEGMMFQSCVTVCYAIGDSSDWKKCASYDGVDSPYNTYKYKGFPPSPIMNPGEAAIISAIEPAKSDYLFFIGDVYGSRKTIFAKTYQEHLSNINKYLK